MSFVTAVALALALCFLWLWRRSVANSSVTSSRGERKTAALDSLAASGSPEQKFRIWEEETLSLSENGSLDEEYVVEYLEEDIAPESSDAREDLMNRSFEIVTGGAASGPWEPSEEGTVCPWTGEDSEQSILSIGDSPTLYRNYGSYLDIAPDSDIFQRNVEKKAPRIKRRPKRPSIYMTRTSLMRDYIGRRHRLGASISVCLDKIYDEL